MTPSAVQAAVKSLRNEGLGLKTCNHYLQSTKSFSRWLRQDKRTREDELVSLTSYNAETDPRYLRRPLTQDELNWLIPVTQQRTRPEHNLPGPDRAMAYMIALGTGFRAKELRSLTPRSFALTHDPPTVTVQAAGSKRRRTDIQPIRQDLAELVGNWLADRPADTRLFADLPQNTARMLRRDMRVARLAWIDAATNGVERTQREASDFLRYENAAGEVVDFHSTRHTYITELVNGGASVKVAQELARHSTPTLTIGLYAHTRLHDLEGALDSLPSPGGFGTDDETLRATGTDNTIAKTPDKSAQRQAQQSARDSLRLLAKPCDEASGTTTQSRSAQLPVRAKKKRVIAA